MHDINPNDLKLYLIKPGEITPTGYTSLLLDFYYKWMDVWRKSYIKLGAREDAIEKLYSDRLLIQDELVILTYQGEIVSGASFKIFNLANQLHLHQEYFSDIDELTMKKLLKISVDNKFISCGDLTLISKFTTSKSDFNWKYLILAALFERSIRQDNGPLVAYTNNIMKITKGCVDLGAEVIKKEFKHHLPFGASCVVDVIYVNDRTLENVSEEMKVYGLLARDLLDRCYSNSDIPVFSRERKKSTG